MLDEEDDAELAALLRRAYAASEDGLDAEEQTRMDLLLSRRGRVVTEEHPDTDEVPDETEAVSIPSPVEGAKTGERTTASRSRSIVAVTAVGVVLGTAGYVAGANLSRGVEERSPYLTGDELRAALDRPIEGWVELAPPSAIDPDPGSLFLSTVIDDNPVWVWTEKKGRDVCYYVDFGVAEANINSCSEVTPHLTASIGLASLNPLLTDPSDLGIYYLSVFDGGVPYITFVPKT